MRLRLPAVGARSAGGDGVGGGVYDDELDDSFELLSSGPGMRAMDESADDMEAAAWTRRHIRAEMAGNGTGDGISADSAPDGAAVGGTGGRGEGEGGSGGASLPHTALEWLRAIGLGQYETAMRAHGMVRLELAAALTENDCARLNVAPRHREKLLGSANLLAKRLEARGRRVPRGQAAVDTSGYAAVQALHYDEETGEFWHEAGEPSSGGEARPTGVDSAQAPPPRLGISRPPLTSGRGRGAGAGGGPSREQMARQRDRKEQNKAKVSHRLRRLRQPA
jgi:hypothetical protein